MKENKIKRKKTLVIGVARGGLIQAQTIAYALNIRDLVTVQSKRYFDKEVNGDITTVTGTISINYEDYDTILVVDDIYDSGETMHNLINILKAEAEFFAKKIPDIIPVVTYTQHSKKTMVEQGIIFGKKINKVDGGQPWVVFPYDTKDGE